MAYVERITDRIMYRKTDAFVNIGNYDVVNKARYSALVDVEHEQLEDMTDVIFVAIYESHNSRSKELKETS